MTNLTFDDLEPKNNSEVAYFTGVYQQLPVFPVNGDVDAPNKKYKSPLISGGFKSATTDPKQIEAWFTRHPNAMVGTPTGSTTGMAVIDIDVKNGIDGFASLKELEGELGALPETYTIETPSGGWHMLLTLPKGVEISSAVNIAPAIDTRIEGAYIVAEGSKNSIGQEYKAVRTTRMMPLPEKWIEFFSSKKSKKSVIAENGFIEEGARNANMSRVIGHFRNMGLEDEALWEAVQYFNQNFCKPSLEEVELEGIFNSLGSSDRGYAHTAIGNGQRFADRHANNVKCINGRGTSKMWMVWDEVQWKEDTLAIVNEYCKQIAIDLQVEAENLPKDTDTGIAKSLYGHARKTQDNPSKILSQACSEPKIAITQDHFDKQDYIIPCSNGYVGLNEGTFHPHDHSLYYTRIVNASYNPDAVCQEWDEYIKFFTGGDPEIEAFLARVYGGLGLVGANPEQKAIFLLGRAKNGKSTLHNILQGIMPDYSDILRTEVLAARGTRDFRHDIADLNNARLVTANEMPQNAKINGATFKALTGGDKQKGRQNYADSETFDPKGLISLTSNWEPQLDDGDEGIERRIIVYRNNALVTKRDVRITEKIIANPDAVFMWLLKGRMDYVNALKQYEEGLIDDPLKTPQKVIDMTEAYLNRRNTFRAFLIDKCVTGNPTDNE